MSDFPLGQPIRLGFLTYSDPENTTLADPSTVTFTIHTPDGTVQTYTLAGGDVVRSSVGDFHLDYTPALAGHYELRQVGTGAVETVRTDAFEVLASFTQVISVTDIRSSALKKRLPNDDGTIQRMLDAALAEYETFVGPLPGSVTEFHDGGRDSIILASPMATITAAAYTDGTSITVSDLTARNGIVRWGYGTAGRFSYGTQNVEITYTAGSLPANHREAIIADVAGYFAATQRAGEPRVDENGYAAGFFNAPTNLFPRIRALAVPGIA